MKPSVALLALSFGTLSPLWAHSEDMPLDFQLRIPFHLQYLNIHTNRLGSFGLAAWTILSDVTAKNNETSTLSLIGPLWNYDQKGGWLEIMGGSKRNDDGYIDPVFDLRLLDRSLPRVNCAVELAYFPRQERERVYAWFAIDTPIRIRDYVPRLGIESENIFSLSGRDSLGIGPRLTLPLPVNRISGKLSSALSMTWQYRNDQDFMRCYLGLACTLGKK